MKKIGFVTGSRADYGIMRRYFDLLNKDQDVDFGIIVTGALLDNEYGHQVDLIYNDGFKVINEIYVKLDSSTNQGIINTMADVLKQFGEYFENNKFDLLIILGDRYEMLSVATAASMQRIPILHIHGGEATYGNYDEFIRHAITKMSLYHFTATENYKKRVIQLGEDPSRVFNLGALGAENCLYIDENNVPRCIKKLKYKKYFVVLFHPETLTNVDTLTQINELLLSIDEFNNYKFIFLGTNADTHSDVIRNRVKNYIDKNENCIYFENLHTNAYHYLLKNSICLIGNSSSGIIEAPSLGIHTINIGDRQKGRVRGNSVIDVICNNINIKKAINDVLGIFNTIDPINPYYQKNSSMQYYFKTKELLIKLDKDISNPKIFYDINHN